MAAGEGYNCLVRTQRRCIPTNGLRFFNALGTVMDSEDLLRITVRDAQPADVPALTAIKGQGSEAVHLDRLRDARGGECRYLVLLMTDQIIGFCCLVLRRPAHWSDADDRDHLPQIVDLQVLESQRGRGFGSAFIHAMEPMAADMGCRELYLTVEPRDNPRAYALYRRLGYIPLQPEPYLKSWTFTDSRGDVHRGEDWVVDMVKAL
ncbi:MAG: GNAT family N-acetyltransferase [Anaerolineae bacterium]|nr:GNAT family N-acetyltransferase [Anaerolineae bacterium]